MTGFTPSIPYQVRRRNEIEALLTLCFRHPFNACWRRRLFTVLFG